MFFSIAWLLHDGDVGVAAMGAKWAVAPPWKCGGCRESEVHGQPVVAVVHDVEGHSAMYCAVRLGTVYCNRVRG